MKKFYFLLLALGLFASANAQIINIPDANFKNKLLEPNVAENLIGAIFNIDANSNGEIEILEAQQVRSLDIGMSNISDLSGIEYFVNLETLNCYSNQLTSLNVSNNSNLEFLNCHSNLLTTINLPNSSSLRNLGCHSNQLGTLDLSNQFNLVILECNSNQLTSINISNCLDLFQLYCGANQLSSLNVSNNSNLVTLSCDQNLITSLDISNNLNLDLLHCGSNELTNLDVTNNFVLRELGCSSNQLNIINLSNNPNLESLFCSSNQLSSLNLSNNSLLINLDCSSNLLYDINISNNTNLSSVNLSSNFLTSLDLTNQSNIDYLYFNNNQISSVDLSNISNLQQLSCTYNQLTTLNLTNNPNLQDLNCSNNPLQSIFLKNNSNEMYYDYINDIQFQTLNFNNLPNLQYICADDFQVDVIQNKIIEYGYANCHVNSYCSFTPGGEFYTIQGNNRYDSNSNGCDATDLPNPNVRFNVTDGLINGTIISNTTGNYSIPIQAGIYTITPAFEVPAYFTISPSNVVVDFPTQVSPFTQDFCLAANGVHPDLEIVLMPTVSARPGFDAICKLIYKNKGTNTQSGTVSLAFDDARLDFVSSVPTTNTQTAGNLTWDFTNLQPFETREIALTLNVNSPMETPAVNGGDVLNYTATITSVATDETPDDNTFAFNQTVVNSFDPNDKTCLEGATIAPSEVGKYVHYMIRFENTGTFPAENIVVKDMIDTNKFDINTLVPIKGSHDFFTRINGNKVEFIFENINLPFDDANNDGYVAFKIKTKPTLVNGDTFSNSANIYFDYNFPIVTNTATTTIQALSAQDFSFGTYFMLYPNPVNDVLNIETKQTIEVSSISIYNQLGQLVLVVPSAQHISKVDVSNLAAGNYFIKINSDKGTSNVKFIKK